MIGQGEGEVDTLLPCSDFCLILVDRVDVDIGDPWVYCIYDSCDITSRCMAREDEIELSRDRLVAGNRSKSHISILHEREDEFIVSIEDECPAREIETLRNHRMEFSESHDDAIIESVIPHCSWMIEGALCACMDRWYISESIHKVSLDISTQAFHRSSDEDSSEALFLRKWLYRDILQEVIIERIYRVFGVDFPDFEKSEMLTVLQILTRTHRETRGERASHVSILFVVGISDTDSITHIGESDTCIECSTRKRITIDLVPSFLTPVSEREVTECYLMIFLRDRESS